MASQNLCINRFDGYELIRHEQVDPRNSRVDENPKFHKSFEKVAKPTRLALLQIIFKVFEQLFRGWIEKLLLLLFLKRKWRNL